MADARPRPVPIPVLLHSAGLVHPSLRARAALRMALNGLTEVTLEPVGGLDAISTCLRSDHAGLVAYFHDRRASPDSLDVVEAFVHQGGGLLAVHAASASFKQQPRWRSLLGGCFVRHGPVQTFRVQPAAERDEIFGRLPSFEVRDELYRHEWDRNNRIHLYVEVDGQREPVLWTREHGKGRIAYFSLGHRAEALRHPSAVIVLRRALLWTVGKLDPTS
jgi:type 1 glutamine amidotransferase